MNKKKFVAFTLAMALTLGSSMTVFAAAPGTDADGDANSAGEQTTTGSGTITTLDDVIKVKLPSTTFGVVADVSGAYGAFLANGSEALENVDRADLAGYAGKLVTKDKLVVTNLGSVPIKVTASFKDTSEGTKKPTHESAITDVKGSTNDYAVWMAAVPSLTDTVGDVDNYTTDNKGYKFTTTATNVNAYLEPAKYLVAGDETNGFTQVKDADDTGHGQAFDIVGYLDTDADWSEEAATGFAGSTNQGVIKVEVKFTLATATTADTTAFEALAAGTPYGMLDGTLVDTVDASVPSVTAGTTVGTIKYNAGTGNDAIASISKVEIKNGSGTKTYDVYHALSGSWGAATDTSGLITIDSGAISTFASQYSTSTCEAIVTYTTTGGDTKTAKVNLKLK